MRSSMERYKGVKLTSCRESFVIYLVCLVLAYALAHHVKQQSRSLGSLPESEFIMEAWAYLLLKNDGESDQIEITSQG